MSMLPYTYRGYRYTEVEHALFKAFKRAGHIAKQARPERYCVNINYATGATELWKHTRNTPSGYKMERMIASMDRRLTVDVLDARGIPYRQWGF